ncbi:Programmed cell death protein [Gracilaria domingensis]|nr:Programmed cell death protein [Gracilaria domingensis]
MSTSCILGFASSEWKSETAEWYDTHIGGIAALPEGLCLQIPPCPLCRRHRTLVLQAYAPHSVHPQRELYLYGCNSIHCSAQAESWYPIRVVKCAQVESSASAALSELQLTAKRQAVNWDSDSDSSDSNDSSQDALLQELEQLTLALKHSEKNEKIGTRKKKSDKRTASLTSTRTELKEEERTRSSSISLASFYVQVDNEPYSEQSHQDEKQVSRLLSRYKEDEKLRSKNGISEQWEREPDEQDKPEEVALQKFNERIARAPEQIIRYNLGGEPLWPRHPPPHMETKTCECGAPMIFELQLLASCIHYLRPEDALPAEQKEAGMNFASVAIYTCANDCEQTKVIAESHSFKGFAQRICVQRDDW